MTTALDGSAAVLAPGDTRRMPIGRAVRRALAAVLVFVLFTAVTKQVHAIYSHVPWSEDPYDTFVSFAIFLVPLSVAAAVGRLALCQAGEPLPAARAEGLVRAVRLALGLSLVALAADWAGVLFTWPAARPDPLALVAIAGLAVTSAVIVAGTAGLARVHLPAPAPMEPDGLADGVALLRLIERRVASLRRPMSWAATLGERRIAPLIRRRPVSTAAVLALAFGAGLALTSMREEGLSPVLWLSFGVAACGMFAFLVLAGSWLRLVAPAPSSALHRRLVMAATVGAAAVPAALAFRETAWDLLGKGGTRGLADLVFLVAVAGVVTFAAVLAALTLLRPSR